MGESLACSLVEGGQRYAGLGFPLGESAEVLFVLKIVEVVGIVEFDPEHREFRFPGNVNGVAVRILATWIYPGVFPFFWEEVLVVHLDLGKKELVH